MSGYYEFFIIAVHPQEPSQYYDLCATKFMDLHGWNNEVYIIPGGTSWLSIIIYGYIDSVISDKE